jgi:hypothetical protein
MKRKRRDRNGALQRVSHNINLLDRPMFVASPQKARMNVYSDNNGFTIFSLAKYGLPTLFDKKMVYLLTNEAQKRGTNIIEFNSIYDMMQHFDLGTSIKDYRRIDQSLNRLANTRLEFTDNSFYETSSKSKTIRSLAILGDLLLSRDVIRITIEQSFLDLHKMQFVRMIPIATIMKFTNPVALRLFEITTKIIGSSVWSIGLDKLQAKLAVNYNRRRDAIRSLNLAQEELRQVSGYEHFTYEIGDNDVVTFKKRG